MRLVTFNDGTLCRRDGDRQMCRTSDGQRNREERDRKEREKKIRDKRGKRRRESRRRERRERKKEKVMRKERREEWRGYGKQ